jgi:translation initiation factor 2 gamma subunit (eIF-2gamma)
MRIQYQQSELRISFGGSQVDNVKAASAAQASLASLSAEEVQAMINSSLDKNNLTMQSSWKETQQKLDASITKNLAQNSNKIDKLVRDASAASQDQIRQFVSGMQTENLQLVKNYFKLSADEQKQYIESLLVDFSKYLQAATKRRSPACSNPVE